MNPFVVDLSLSFVLGGLWVALASVAAQRFGGKIGGFIAGLPVTAVIAIFFITWSEGARHGYDVTQVFPLTISANALFLAAYAAFSRKSFLAGLGAALVIWTTAAAALLMVRPLEFWLSLSIGVAVFIASALFTARLKIPDPGQRPVTQSTGEIAVRAVAGGSIIAAALMGSHWGGPALGGILSAFPATVLATLVITATCGGRDVCRIMALPMMTSGVVNCIVFALVFRQVVLQMHVIAAVGLAYGVTMLSSILTFYWMNVYRRERVAAIPG